MRVRVRHLFALSLPLLALAIGVACEGTYSDTCASLGGQCVSSETQCAGSLPYPCSAGLTCCVSNGLPAPDGSTASTSSSSSSSTGDSSTPVISLPDAAGHPTTIPDSSTSTSHDSSTGTTPDSSTVGTPDVSTTPDSGQTPIPDANTADQGPVTIPDASSHDATSVDSSSHDASHDSSAHDSATVEASMSSEAGAGCAAFAAPNTTAGCVGCLDSNPPVTNCQANGCYGGYYCRTSTLGCVKPTSVNCDGGT